jgi:hypothetical protein
MVEFNPLVASNSPLLAGLSRAAAPVGTGQVAEHLIVAIGWGRIVFEFTIGSLPEPAV